MKVEESILEGLKDKKSAKRRSAAKKLRKLGDTSACGALLDALVKELKDKRTWETQYCIITALGLCNCKRAIGELRAALDKDLEIMPKSGVGYSLAILDNLDMTIEFLVGNGHRDGLIGLLWACAEQDLIPSDESIKKIIGSKLINDDSVAYWFIIASAHWDYVVPEYVIRLAGEEEGIKELIEMAINKKPRKNYGFL